MCYVLVGNELHRPKIQPIKAALRQEFGIKPDFVLSDFMLGGAGSRALQQLKQKIQHTLSGQDHLSGIILLADIADRGSDFHRLVQNAKTIANLYREKQIIIGWVHLTHDDFMVAQMTVIEPGQCYVPNWVDVDILMNITQPA